MDVFAELSRLGALIRQLQGASKVAFPFGVGWANFAGVEGATYSRHGRVVRLQGMVTKSGGTPAAGNVIGTLPDGYKPTGQLVFAAVTGSTDTFGRVDVDASGNVIWQSGGTGGTDYTSLSGISFVVD